MVEGTDRQVPGFIGVFQGDDGTVQGVGQVAEPRPAWLNNLYGALQRVRGGIRRKVFSVRADETDLPWQCRRGSVQTSQRCRSQKGDTRSWSNALFQGRFQDTPFVSRPASSSPQTPCGPDPALSGTTCGRTNHWDEEIKRQQQSKIDGWIVFTTGAGIIWIVTLFSWMFLWIW